MTWAMLRIPIRDYELNNTQLLPHKAASYESQYGIMSATESPKNNTFSAVTNPNTGLWGRQGVLMDGLTVSYESQYGIMRCKISLSSVRVCRLRIPIRDYEAWSVPSGGNVRYSYESQYGIMRVKIARPVPFVSGYESQYGIMSHYLRSTKTHRFKVTNPNTGLWV